MTARSPRSLEFSVCVCRLLLWVYPASFRRQYTGEMTRVFRELAAAALERCGAVGLVVLWLRIVPDIVSSAASEHCTETERRVAMWRQFWGPAHLPAALTLSLLLAALVTPADPASMLIAAGPVFGVYLAALMSRGIGPRGRALAILACALHALAWIRVLALPASLAVGTEAVRSEVRVAPSVAIAVTMFVLPVATTAVLVGLVALLPRGRKRAGKPGTSEEAEIVG
jgi:hypothetical protein